MKNNTNGAQALKRCGDTENKCKLHIIEKNLLFTNLKLQMNDSRVYKICVLLRINYYILTTLIDSISS
jgi:hypothetical protein